MLGLSTTGTKAFIMETKEKDRLKKAGSYIFILSWLIAGLILINGGYAIYNMVQVKQEFFNVANRDLPMAKKLLPLLDRQFEQTILIEKMQSAKLSHRKVFLGVLADHFDRIGKQFRETIKQLDGFIKKNLQSSNLRTRQEMKRVKGAIERIEKEHEDYEQHIHKLIKKIRKKHKGQTKKFTTVFAEEEELRAEVQSLRDEVQQFTQTSAREVEKIEQQTIYGTSIFSFIMYLFGIVILFLIYKLIKSREAALHSIAFHASHDPLTGVLNRRAFFESLEAAIKNSVENRHPLSLCICDLDYFKKINDTYGHQAGDEVIMYFSKLLSEEMNGKGTVGRFGGDEFVVYMPETAPSTARALFERIRAGMASHEFPLPTGTGSFKASSTFGIAGLDKAVPDADRLLEKADRALYSAKEKGRNTVETID